MKMFDFLKNDKLNGCLHGLGMKIGAAKPEIMLFGGGLSVLLGTIYACMQTEKAKKAINDCKDDIAKVDEQLKLPEGDEIEVLPATKKQMKVEKGRQYTKIYGRTMYELIKIYGIPALLWFGGMGFIVGSHGELRKMNKHLAADIVAGNQMLKEYRERVAKAVGDETEEKIFMGAQEGMVKVLDKDPETGEEKLVEKKADVFYAQPGSVFARNFTASTSDAFDIRSFADRYLDDRINEINTKLELGVYRAFNALDILRMLGFNENALTEKIDDDDGMEKLLHYGISGNARKVPDPEMRKLKVTRLRGYEKQWDVAHEMEIFVPCVRLDFNFYPLEGKI